MLTAVISGNRADRAALTPVAEALDAKWIYVDTLPSRDRFDSAVSCSQAMVMAAEQLNNLKPDLVIVAGDRFEILGAATAAHLMSIPIAHLSGGDITEGSQDDAMRHAITKLAAIHFPTNQASADRIVAMGEEKWRIHMVGAPQIDYLLKQELYSREETKKRLGFNFPKIWNQKYILVAYQPPTGVEDPTAEIDGLLKDLKGTGLHCIFTTVNPDAGGIEITRKIIRFCLPGIHAIVNMDHKLFLSAMKYCEYMTGNSSAGFYEAPTLGTKFVNIGFRQNGRVPITGDGKAAERIKLSLKALMTIPRSTLLRKIWGVPCSSTDHGNGSTQNDRGVLTPRKNWSDGHLGDQGLFQEQGSWTWGQGRDQARGF